MFLNGDFSLKNDTIDQIIMKLIANSFSSDLLTSICNFLGGITFDEKHRISGPVKNLQFLFYSFFHFFSNLSIFPFQFSNILIS